MVCHSFASENRFKETPDMTSGRQRGVTSAAGPGGSWPSPFTEGDMGHLYTALWHQAERRQRAPLRDNKGCLMGSLFHFPRAGPLPLTFFF